MASDILGAINELIGAVNGLIIVQTQAVSVDCGCNVGQGPDNGEGEEGGPVPDPVGDIIFDEPAPIDDRKCKAADYLANWLRNIIFRDILVAQSIDAKAQLGIVLALGALGSILGLIGGIAGAVVGGVGGLLLGAILAIIQQELDFSQIQDVMDANIQELVCALYEATSVAQAKANFRQVLEDAGTLSSAEVDFTMLWLPNALLNLLFFDITSPFDSAAFFDGYEFVTGCEACTEPEQLWTFLRSGEFGGRTGPTELGTGVIDNGGGSFTISSVPGFISGTPTNVLGIITEGFRQSQVGDTSMLTLPSGTAGGTLNVTVYPSPGPSRDGRRCNTCGAAITVENIGGTGVVTGRQMAVWHRSTPFSITLQVDVQPDICP